MPNFNYPDPSDPKFNDKIVDLLQQLFDSKESPIQNFTPIDQPEEGTQVGSIWYDTTDDKFKVMTSSGIKILKYE